MKRLTAFLFPLLLICTLALPARAEFLGYYAVGDTAVCGYVNTYQPSTGASFTLASGAVSVTKGNSATQSTAGVTFDNDFDSVTGRHQACIDTSADGTFYSAGATFFAYLSAGTVDSVSVVGAPVFSFKLGEPAVNVESWNASAVTDIEDSDDIVAALIAYACGSETADTLGERICDDITTIVGSSDDAKTAAESVETTIGAAGAGLTEAGGTGDQLTALATAAALATVDTEVGVIDGIVDDILVDTGTTIPGTITTIDNEIAVIDGNVDDIELVLGTPTDTDIATDIANVLAEFAIIDVKSMQGIDVCITSGGAFTSENSSNCP